MEEDITLKLENVGPIDNAKINIGKINIVGGKNSTGKSTSSKLLYCFLRSNSSNRQELALKSLRNSIEELNRNLKRFLPFEYKTAEIFRPSYFSARKEMNLEDLIDAFDEMNYIYGKFLNNIYSESPNSDDFNNKSYKTNKKFQTAIDNLEEKIETTKHLIYIIDSNSYELYTSIIRNLLELEFNIDEDEKTNGFACLYSKEEDFKYTIDFNEYKFEYENFLYIEEVYYIDSFSIFDMKGEGNFNSEHVQTLYKALLDDKGSKDMFDKIVNENIIKIEKEIYEIIGGKVEYNKREFNYQNDSISVQMKNTASGIKQIGIIQLLLANRKLKPNCFLVFDEPEVNLHPEWQIKLAEVLVLIAAKLDIIIYINTHSPLFIEAIDAYSEYYEIEDDTNYYLTSPAEKEGFFNITEIDSDELYVIYDNLGNPYEELDVVRVMSKYKDDE